MVSVNITIQQSRGRSTKKTVRLDIGEFRQLAELLGIYGSDFLKSLTRSEKDFKEGRFRELKSLADLNK